MTSLNLKNCINIPDDYDGKLTLNSLCLDQIVTLLYSFKGYNTNLFCIPNHYVDAVENVLIPNGKNYNVDTIIIDVIGRLGIILVEIIL